ncbi:MAG TPA: hypothetical protein VFH78_10380 [Candidatus Thermoplasmatota archaeon]|nr:hypothetical protein [Candidatus Thermoplasmatota archaeon]
MAPMRTLVLLLAAAALVASLPGAHAQQSGALILTLEAPAEPVREGGMVTFLGTVTLTVDYTAMLSLSGIPVSYSVANAPAWASVVISPASDVFPMPSHPHPGTSYSVTRQIAVTVSAADVPERDTVAAVEIAAVTSPGFAGRSFTGNGATPVAFDVADEACDAAHAEELAAPARQAAQAYAKHQTSGNGAQDASAEELTTQSAGARPLPLPYAVVAGFAILGAGIGLVLRRRAGR